MPYAAAGSHSNLTQLTVTSNVKHIHHNAFDKCQYLTKLVIEDQHDNTHTLTIHDDAFFNTLVENVYIPASVIHIGKGNFTNNFWHDYVEYSFTVHPDNQHYTEYEGVLYDKQMHTLIIYPASKKNTAFTVPPTVNNIQEYAFCNNSLKELALPNNIQHIGTCAFSQGDYHNCQLIRVYTYDTNIDTDTHLDGTIHFAAFSGCSDLEAVMIPNGIKHIDNYAFGGCRELVLVKWSNNIQSIGDKAFFESSDLILTQLPDTLQSLGSEPFNLWMIRQLHIPKALTNIHETCFANADCLWQCNRLHQFTVHPDNPNYTAIDGVLYDKQLTTLVAYPCGSTDTTFTLPPSVHSINSHVFAECEHLKEVILNPHMHSIGDSVFLKCRQLEKVVMPTTLQHLGKGVFSGCSKMDNVSLPDNLTSLPDYTFFYCNSLTHLSIPNNILHIGKSALYNCCNLKEISLPPNLQSLDTCALAHCDIITQLNIPNSVIHVGNGCIAWCGKLKNVQLPKHLNLDAMTVYDA
jgi:hypothetical protein